MAITRLRPIDTDAQKKAERNRRLSESDWTQMPDSPLSAADKKAWMDYRAALRDMTFPEGFTWPSTPDQEKAAKPVAKKPRKKAVKKA